VKSARVLVPPANQRPDAAQVLDILTRWDRRMRGHQTQKREQERHEYTARMSLYHHDIKPRTGQEKDTSPIDVWGRNVSARGIGFIYKGRIPAKRVILCLDPDLGAKTWIQVEIVRSRQVHNDFWEYGAKFVDRATRQEAERPLNDKR
jgi:PilZ domain